MIVAIEQSPKNDDGGTAINGIWDVASDKGHLFRHTMTAAVTAGTAARTFSVVVCYTSARKRINQARKEVGLFSFLIPFLHFDVAI